MSPTSFAQQSLNTNKQPVYDDFLVGNLPNTGNYVSIATATVTSGGASTITFSSIPQTFTHLQLRGIGRVTGAVVDENIAMRFNSDSNSTYSSHNLAGDNTAVRVNADPYNSSVHCIRATGASSSADMFGSGIVDILDYSNTNKYKTIRTLSGHTQNSSNTGTNSTVFYTRF